MSWGPRAPTKPRLALSLRRLGQAIDDRWPDRSRASDGWLGDHAHQQRLSDHNPDRDGVVRAIDITAHGVEPLHLVHAAIAHPSTEYVIYSGRIWTRQSGFRSQRYAGPDPHVTHVHVSIRPGREAAQSRAVWAVK